MINNQQLLVEKIQQAVIYLEQGQPMLAINLLDVLLGLLPIHSEVLFLRGAASSMMGDRAAAIDFYDRLLSIAPNFLPALNAKGLDLAALGRHVEALNAFDTALGFQPQFVDAVINKSALLNELGRYHETIVLLGPCEQARHLPLQLNLGIAFFKVNDFSQAERCAQAALSMSPSESAALSLMGAIRLKQKVLDEALAYFCRAAESNPIDASVQNNIAVVLAEQGRFSEAAAAYEKTLRLDDHYPFARGSLLHAQMKSVIWTGHEQIVNKLKQGIAIGKKESDPFSLLAADFDAKTQKQCAEIYVRDRYSSAQPYTSWSLARDGKVRVAYLSADFCNHATSYLMAELFELHDRSRFQVIGICHGRSPDDAMRQRVSRSFDQFHEVAHKSDQEIAALIHDLGVDILVDLKGHTTETRMGVLAYRPAPIQVHYLGYPGTTGASFVDYLIADAVLIPEQHQEDYTEKIAYLPDSYQVNDTKREISDRVFTRSEMGLPEVGFVFCSFNNSFKITPDLFDVWMNLLKSVEGSVLWLLQDNPTAAENLQREANQRGVAPSRLVFAKRMPLAEHLARHSLADLFLDTWYCNAHTTASDALWAGLPIVTKIGKTFAGRVAASLLYAVDLAELVAESTSAYEELALTLAKDPSKLKLLKENLNQRVKGEPLYNTPQFAIGLEKIYLQMLARQRAGGSPQHIQLLEKI